MLRLTLASARNGGAEAPPIFKLALGQLISWGTLYYGITFLAQPISEDTRWSLPSIFGAFSAGLLLAALAAAPVGRLVHHFGGRTTMTSGSFAAATAFVVISASDSLLQFYGGWLIAGAAMSMTLYEAAFSALRQYNQFDFRRSIGIVTVVGGFASTVFWPLTHMLASDFGWRATLVVFAGLHLLVCAPIHFQLTPHCRTEKKTPEELKNELKPYQPLTPAMWFAVSLGLSAIVTSVISAQAAAMLTGLNVPIWQAMVALSLIGPMQVAGRVVELSASRHVSVIATGQVALTCLALSMAFLLFAGMQPGWVFGFAILYGAANGVMTVVRGAIPSELLGHLNYAGMLGVISSPALVARAVGPLAGADTLARWGVAPTIYMLVAASLLGGTAFGYASFLLRKKHRYAS